MPADLRVQPRVERGETGPVLVDVASEPGDLLVIGTGRRNPVGRALRRSVGRYCLAHARCPVLAVPPSALMDELSRVAGGTAAGPGAGCARRAQKAPPAG